MISKRAFEKLFIAGMILTIAAALLVIPAKMYKSWAIGIAMESIRKDDAKTLERRLSWGLSPDTLAREENAECDFPLLVHAISYKSAKCVDVLLKHGADVNVDVYGYKAFCFAQDIGMLKRLLQEPTCVISSIQDLDCIQPDEWYYHPDIAKLLIERGFDPSDVFPRSRTTILMQIALFSDKTQLVPGSPIYKTIDIFVNAGADVNAKDYSGFTAAKIATYKKNPMLAEYFSQLEAKEE